MPASFDEAMAIITQEALENEGSFSDSPSYGEGITPLYGRCAQVMAFVHELRKKQVQVKCRDTRRGLFYLLSNEQLTQYDHYKQTVRGIPMIIDDAAWHHYLHFVDPQVNKAYKPLCPGVVIVSPDACQASELWKQRMAPLPSPPLRTEDSGPCFTS